MVYQVPPGNIPPPQTQQPAPPAQPPPGPSKLEVTKENAGPAGPSLADIEAQALQNVEQQPALGQVGGGQPAEGDDRSFQFENSISGLRRDYPVTPAIQEQMAQLQAEMAEAAPPAPGQLPPAADSESAQPAQPPADATNGIAINGQYYHPSQIEEILEQGQGAQQAAMEANAIRADAQRAIAEAQEAVAASRAQASEAQHLANMARTDPEAFLQYQQTLAQQQPQPGQLPQQPAGVSREEVVQLLNQHAAQQAAESNRTAVLNAMTEAVQSESARPEFQDDSGALRDMAQRVLASRAADLVSADKITRETPIGEVRAVVKKLADEEVARFGTLRKGEVSKQLANLEQQQQERTVPTSTAPPGTVSPAQKVTKPNYGQMTPEDVTNRILASMELLDR